MKRLHVLFLGVPFYTITLSIVLTFCHTGALSAAGMEECTDKMGQGRRIQYLENFSFENSHFKTSLSLARQNFNAKRYSKSLPYLISAERECGFLHKDGLVIGGVEFYVNYDEDAKEEEGSGFFESLPEIDDTDFWNKLEASGVLEQRCDRPEDTKKPEAAVPAATLTKPPRPPGPTKARPTQTPLSIRIPPKPYEGELPFDTGQTEEEKILLESMFS